MRRPPTPGRHGPGTADPAAFPTGPSPPAGWLPDDDTLRDALRDDCIVEAALTTVYQQHGARVQRHLLRFGIDADTAADAVQEAVIALWQQRATLPAGVALGAWLATVAARRVIDARRVAARQDPHRTVGVHTARLAAPPPDDLVLRAERVSQMRRLVRTLAADDQHLLARRYWQAAPLAVIARQCGLTVPAVESWLRRLHRHLREAWVALEDGRPPPLRRRRRAGARPAPRA
jgi:RNA polymerase sigma-70 factor (ECF subfamily)